jgi:hypothetical protein
MDGARGPRTRPSHGRNQRLPPSGHTTLGRQNNEMERTRERPHGRPSPCPVSFANGSNEGPANHADIRDGQEVFGRPPTWSGRFHAA